MRGIPGLDLTEVGDGGTCCGSAGIYNLVQPEAAAELGQRKAAALRATGARLVVSANPGCSLQIAAALAADGGDPVAVAHIAEVLDASLRGLPLSALGVGQPPSNLPLRAQEVGRHEGNRDAEDHLYDVGVSRWVLRGTRSRSRLAVIGEEVHQHFNDWLATAGGFLDGRVTYELMASHWPAADQDPSASAQVIEFARIWRDMPKTVFSRTLEQAGWNTTIVREVVPEQIAELQSAAGRGLGDRRLDPRCVIPGP